MVVGGGGVEGGVAGLWEGVSRRLLGGEPGGGRAYIVRDLAQAVGGDGLCGC